MSNESTTAEFNPSYIAGLLDAIARVRFDISEQPDGTFTVRPMLRIEPAGTEMRKNVVGSFLDLNGYTYDLIDRSRGAEFFRLQRRRDLEDLHEYLVGRSSHVARELEFVVSTFADEFDFEVLDPTDAYQFLLTRDELRYGWHPRGINHTRPKDVQQQYGISSEEIEPLALPAGNLRSDYTIEWIAGLFDGICRYRPSIAQSREYEIGYGMYPVARLHRSGVHSSLVEHVRQFCVDYNLNYGDSSSDHDLRIVFTGASHIRRVLDILAPRLFALAKHSAMIKEEILPRFDENQHHTKQGFFRLLCDFDPIAQDSGGAFRDREYDPAYFAEIWEDNLDLDYEEGGTSGNSGRRTEKETLAEYETVSLGPEDYRDDVGRYQTILDRRKRDEDLVRKLKSRYADRCQLCGDRLAKGDGTGYSEVHHVHPLGQPHDGPDVPENMLVLCPNHHADFDNGVVRFDIDTNRVKHPYDSDVDGREITTEDGHELAEEHLEYHNETISEVKAVDSRQS